MKKQEMIEAFRKLDSMLERPIKLLIGGGSAMLLAYNVSLITHDIDGLPLDSQMSASELDPLIKKVAEELKISPHWYNDYFSTFTYALPKDFRERLATVFKGQKLKVEALGKEDLLIMKCFAGREKDIGHARALLKKGANYKIVEKQISELIEKGLPNSKNAMNFLEDLLAEMENA